MIAKITETLVAADPLKVLFGLYSLIASVNFISYITILVQMFLNTQEVNNEGQRQWTEESSSVLFAIVALLACLTYLSIVVYKIYKNVNEMSSSSMIGRMTGS